MKNKDFFDIEERPGHVDLLARNDLFDLVRAKISVLKGKDELKEKVVETITARIEDPDNDITLASLIRLLEILNKSENENFSSLLNMFKPEIHISPKEDDSHPPGEKDVTPGTTHKEYSVAEVQEAKKILDILDSVKEKTDEKKV